MSESAGTQATKVTRLVERLVARSIPPARSRDTVRFALRVLGSRIEPSAVADEFQVSSRIKKQILKSGKPGSGHRTSGTGYSTALRFDELFRKLCTQGVVRRKWAVLTKTISENV